jgi:hypothetical protein
VHFRSFQNGNVLLYPGSDFLFFCCFLGEIHSDWREVIAKGVNDKNLPITLTSPNTIHEDSDDCGAIILVSTIIGRHWGTLAFFAYSMDQQSQNISREWRKNATTGTKLVLV